MSLKVWVKANAALQSSDCPERPSTEDEAMYSTDDPNNFDSMNDNDDMDIDHDQDRVLNLQAWIRVITKTPAIVLGTTIPKVMSEWTTITMRGRRRPDLFASGIFSFLLRETL